MWLSLVERLNGVQETASSNLVTPTKVLMIIAHSAKALPESIDPAGFFMGNSKYKSAKQSFYGIHIADKVKNLVRISPFVIVPCHQFAESVRQGKACSRIKDTGARIV